MENRVLPVPAKATVVTQSVRSPSSNLRQSSSGLCHVWVALAGHDVSCTTALLRSTGSEGQDEAQMRRFVGRWHSCPLYTVL